MAFHKTFQVELHAKHEGHFHDFRVEATMAYPPKDDLPPSVEQDFLLTHLRRISTTSDGSDFGGKSLKDIASAALLFDAKVTQVKVWDQYPHSCVIATRD